MQQKVASCCAIILALSLIATLTGCVQTPPVRQYILITESLPPPPARKVEPVTILIGPVKLASYLDQPRIVRRQGPTRIDTRTGHQWAGNLTEMIRNKLIAEMAGLLQPAPVFSFPDTTAFTEGRRVAIDILRFEGTADNTAIIETRWTLYDLGNRSIITTRPSLFQVPLADDSYEALTTALSQGLSRLGQEIAAEILSSHGEERSRDHDPK